MFVPTAAIREHALIAAAVLAALVLVAAVALGLAPDALLTIRPKF